MILLKQLCTKFKMSTKCIHMTTRYKSRHSKEIYIKFDEMNPLKLTIPYQHLQRKYCFNSFKGDPSDSDSEDSEYKRDIKNIILPNNDDILTTQISECQSLQEVFKLLQLNKNQLNWQSISMAIAMVRELQIIYCRIYAYDKHLNFSNIIAEDNFEKILTNDDFLNLLSLMEKHIDFMDIQCLSYSLLCLHKIGVDVNYTVNQKLSQRLKNILITTPIEEIQSCVLSRFTVSTASRRDLSGVYILKDIWPIILNKMSKYLSLL